MASFLLLRYRVRDFAAWKRGYDAHLPKRVEAGLTETHLFHGATDANEVVLLFEVADLGRAKAFVESAELREATQKVGLLDKPESHFLTR
jgi:heme-degrading monooxygenase HmoA